MPINFRSPQRLLAGAGLAASAFIISQSAAFAHVTLATGEARTGTYYKAVFQVPHGCDGTATQTIRIQIPEGVIGVKPMPKAGWTLSITRGTYAKSYQSHGKAVTEGPKEIASDGQNPHSLKSPAPTLRIVADTATVAQAQMDHSKMDHSQMGAAPTGNDTFKVGDLVVVSPWTRATPGGAKIAGGYLKITNNGKSPDRLVGAATASADRVEIHEMSMTDGVMKMRQLADGLTIKPGETVELKPGGFHMMFMDIKRTFEKAGKLEVSFNVNAIGASGAGAPAHKH